MLLLLEFLLHFSHFFSYTILGAHGQPLAHQFGSKHEEQNRCCEMCEALWDQRWYGVA
jgi:hypothetical protein